ncbi:MAG: DUF1269 domain-containing protein [Silvania sp.]|uniref:DUF1269 domain-containing protein n=1 Tax=Silvania sp. TaxID=3016633 RepID=UPI003EE5E284
MSDALYLQDNISENPPASRQAGRKPLVNVSALLDKNLPPLIQAVIKTEKLKNTANRVDGLIIGTGEADFTKGNTRYSLHIDDKTFQLVDVPGIEGNESRYVHQVREAIAEAHMVVYVNGTNKKPETATAEKIKSYLEYGTQVYPLVNVRGFADAYEFEEDRRDLVQQGAAGEALKQTVGVLEPVLGTDVLLPGNCVQGLLAFSALAYDDATQSTTIHPSRDRNLGAQQKSYFRHFSTRQEMLEFSQIKAVARVIRSKVATFKEDIVESNKGKVRESLGQYLLVLEEQLASHRTFLKRTEPEFEKCRVAFRNAIGAFERQMLNNRRNRWNTFFNELIDKSDDIVDDDFGDSDAIARRINQEFKSRRIRAEQQMQNDTEESVKALQEQMLQAVTRLLEDIKHVEFQQRVSFEQRSGFDFDSDIAMGYDLGLGDFGSMAFKIGSYALTGGTIGSAFPVIGTVIGTVAGALVGVVMTVVGLFTSKSSKIRKAQGKVRDRLETARDKALDGISEETHKLVAAIEKELQGSLLQKVSDMNAALQRPIPIFEEQIKRITKLKNQLEKMPYGTIQTVQH